jgi:hypothetical protein
MAKIRYHDHRPEYENLIVETLEEDERIELNLQLRVLACGNKRKFKD